MAVMIGDREYTYLGGELVPVGVPIPAPPVHPDILKMPAPWVPPEEPAPTQTSGGNGYYQGGNPWSTGYQGSKPDGQSRSWSGGGVGSGYSFPQGSPGYNASVEAAQQGIKWGDDAARRLAGGQFLGDAYGGALGNRAMQDYTSPTGYSDEALAQQRQMLAASAAGSRENNLRAMEEAAAAKGFGDSMGLIDAQSRARAQSTADLNNAYNQLMMENERAKMQQQGIAAGVLGGLASAEGSTALGYAANQLNRQAAIIPGANLYGGGQQGGQSQGGYWDQSGRYQQGSVGYDPFVGGYRQGDNSSAAGGWTPRNPYQPW